MKKDFTLKPKLKLFVLSFLLLLTFQANATHIRGGYLTGKHISGLTYEFNVYIYRDVDGVPPQFGEMEIWNGSQEVLAEIVVPESLGFSPVDSQTEFLKYTITYTFSTEGEYKVSFYEQSRAPGVKNISSSGNNAFFVQSIFYVESSTILNSAPLSAITPRFYARNSTKEYLNPFIYDLDEDSISFRLTTPKQDINETGTGIEVSDYLFPNDSSFHNGDLTKVFKIDQNSGQITVDVSEPGEFHFAFYVDEWKDGKLVSSINFDMQFISIDDHHEIPTYSDPRVGFLENTCITNQSKMLGAIKISNADYYTYESNFTNNSAIKIFERTEVDIGGYHNVLDFEINTDSPEELIGTEFIVKVRAFRGNQFSKDSKQWSFRVFPGTAPAVPTALMGGEKKTLHLSWSPYQSKGSNKMSIWRLKGQEPNFDLSCSDFPNHEVDFEKIGEVDGTDTTFIDYNGGVPISPDTNYFYVLRAEFGEAFSPFSDITLAIESEDTLSSVKGIVFYDENENGIWDEYERALPKINVKLFPENEIAISDSSGNIEFEVPYGVYSIDLLKGNYWEATTPAHNFILNGEKDTVFHIGVKALVEKPFMASIYINSPRVRCGFEVQYNVTVQNNRDFLLENGKVGFVKDSLFTYETANPVPDEINGDTLLWNTALAPLGKEVFKIKLRAPSVEHMGDTLRNGLFYSHPLETVPATKSTKTELTCAYDPNDKLVTPVGVKEENYTLMSEYLEYTVRFQNTGTDTAFNVEIRDELDDNLDLSTFEVVSNSHAVRTHINKFGEAVFAFDDIHLPDSNVNEPASHGFVMYKAMPKAELPDFTKIENTAYIYFDFNPAIVTNTTLNTLVYNIPPDAPDSLEAVEVTKTSVNLSWLDRSDEETGFVVERGNDSFFASFKEFSLPANATSFTDTALNDNTTYYYRVRTENNGILSDFSNVVRVKTLEEVINAPTNLSIGFGDGYHPILTWEDNADNETNYLIERAANNLFNNMTTVSEPADTEGFTDWEIEVGSSYFYRIRAVNSLAVSAPSNVVNVLVTSLEDSKLEEKVFLYPNPASESLYVEVPQELGKEVNYSLKNSAGTVIEQKSVPAQPQIGIDLSRVPQGFYILELSIGDSYFMRKMVKE
ncbi:fibronectin type III domain-containing protein [Flammeovirgaceae bacterium SG7u.111]|nr:fibronectin type III domain-containing protein [Flammeovirgaceae bacterium SG7u.132]WPO34116.1 fibronectin type III domain-containing protein [Flammeovirgaceae bacterium SG7u.111]